MSINSAVIIQHARAKIIDAPWRLISRMGQWACQFPFYLQSWPILPLWKDVTMQPFDCRKGKTKNCWHSIDAHLHDILTVIGCSTIARKMHIVSINSQYIVCMYNHLHPKALRPLCFWATTTHDSWAMNGIAASLYSPFPRQLTPYRSIH